MSNILQPNAVQIDFQHQPGPNAYPHTIPIGGPSGAKVLSHGGLTKLEYIVTQLVSGDLDITPEAAVLIAKRILHVCDQEGKSDVT